MAYPPQREAFHGPSDIASGHGHYKSPQYHSIHNDMQIGSAATPIPGMANRVNAPPPLPPPRFPMGGGDAYSFTPRQSQYNHSVSSSTASTSGYGSMEASWQSERPNFKRRDTGSSTPDSSYASTDSRFPTEFGAFHTKLPLQSPAEMHGDWMKKKLNTARLSDQSGSSLSASLDILRKSNPEKRAPPMLNMPIHSRSVLDSPGRMSDAPVFSAVSPRIGPFSRELDRSRESSDAGSPRHRRRNNSDDASVVHGQYELGSVEDMDMDDGPSLRRLQIDEATRFGAGQKRRAESPAGVSPPFQGTRGSPTPRLTIAPVSSMPSYSSGPSRETSYMSASTAPSIITNFGRRSPGAVSPGAISPTSSNSPYNAPMSLNPSPRGSISQRLAAHVPLAQEPPPMRKEIKSGKMGFLMCECCPKKPKKFETPEELSAHEAEKQYECSYCGNRFKNKNEAERHQNSLHAFHDSTTHPGEADACGYCGDEFARTGRGAGSAAPLHATEQDWDARIKHLQEVHKFRECNSAKKFFRADHFRQHLKHSHAGTSGKWTNLLENACMLEEDPSPR